MRSAKRPHRPEAEFFADPQDTAQRRYEALRAYFLESATAAQAAARFGYAESSVQAIVHYGHDVALETHYLPRRSQRTESVLTFFAQDGQAHNLVYANATCTKPGQAGEVMAFARHWQQATGKLPELLVFDSKVTTGAGLFALDQAGIGFLTLRARSPKLVAALDALPAARVNISEADLFGNHCVVAVSSFGSLIHTAVGSAGGSGGLRTKRSGCWA